MSYTYDSFQAALALYMAIPQANVSSPNFVAALPSIIDYAEQRCYRELDLLAARADWFGVLTPLSPSFPLSGITYPLAADLPPPLTIERARILLPVGITPPLNPTLVEGAIPCSPVSPEWLDAVYGPGADPGVPLWYSQPRKTTSISGRRRTSPTRSRCSACIGRSRSTARRLRTARKPPS